MERGGPSNQSGVFFQNTIAALHLGRMLDGSQRPKTLQIVAVRVEAPDHVDDIVVTYADGHLEWIQAKESLDRGGDPWTKLWRDFVTQRRSSTFGTADRVVLATSLSTALIDNTRNIALRAITSANVTEWKGRLSGELTALLDSVVDSTSPSMELTEAFDLFKSLDVCSWGDVEEIARDRLNDWMPRSTVENTTLLRLLRDRVGGQARVRGRFDAPSLINSLQKSDGVRIHQLFDSVNAYLRGLENLCGTIEIPGTSLSGPMAALFRLPRCSLEKPRAITGLLADEDTDTRKGEPFDVDAFPRESIRRVVVTAGAGFGKTSLLRAIIARLLSEDGWIPALINLSEYAEADEALVDFLMRTTRRDSTTSVDWARYLTNGQAVLLFDGLDEVVVGRQRVVDMLRQLPGANPQMPWILTVRDSATGGLPFGVPVVRIEPLDLSEIEDLAQCYERFGEKNLTTTIVQRAQRDPDFLRLVSVPLFLALVIATGTASEQGARTNVLDRYLSLAFGTERRRATATVTDYDLLRIAGEILAEQSLLGGGTRIPEPQAHTVLRQAIGNRATTTTVLRDLGLCGVLRKTGASYEFCLPTVQEFLAGSSLARTPDRIPELFDRLRLRPWAQTIQFALEIMPDATQSVQSILRRPPDAHYSILRLVGRAIVNGSRVSSEVTQSVGVQLVEWWLVAPTWTHRHQAADLLAAGWRHQPPTRILTEARKARHHQEGGGKLAAALRNKELTLALLGNILDERAGWTLHLREFQQAVNDVADEALELYVQVGRGHEGLYAYNAGWLASRLDAKRIDQSRLSAHLAINDLPALLRLGLLLITVPLRTEAIGELAETMLIITSAGPEHVHESLFSVWALDAIGWPKKRIDSVVNSGNLHAIECILSELMGETKNSSAVRRERLESLRNLPPWAYQWRQILLLANGEEEQLESIFDSINELAIKQRDLFAIVLVRRGDGPSVNRLIDHINNHNWDLSIGRQMSFAAEREVVLLEVLGAMTGRTRRLPSPVRELLQHQLYLWASKADGEQRLGLLCASAQLGSMEGLIALKSSVLQFRNNGSADDTLLAESIRTLAESAVRLELEELCSVVNSSKLGNAGSAAATAIAAGGTRECLDKLVQLQQRRDLPYGTIQAIEEGLETLAAHLGLVLHRNAGLVEVAEL